jgi:cytosine/uracil/thiamine/allantoin permease
MFELDVSSLSAIIAAIGVMIGVILTVLEVRNWVNTRQTDLVARARYKKRGKESKRENSRISIPTGKSLVYRM